MKQGRDHEYERRSGPIIAVIDDEESVREAIASLLKSRHFRARTFESAQRFMNSGEFSNTTCLILDVRMPTMDGLELQRRLGAQGCRLPIIFITAHEDERVRMRAMQAGAIDCLFKPFTEEALLAAIGSALRCAEGDA